MQKMFQPEFEFEGLKIWVDGRQFPDVKEYLRGNRLIVKIQCSNKNREFTTQYTIAFTFEFEQWLNETQRLYEELKGEVHINFLKTELSIDLLPDKFGHIEMTVKMGQSTWYKQQEYTFKVDQTFLPTLIQSLQSLLVKYSVLYREEQGS